MKSFFTYLFIQMSTLLVSILPFIENFLQIIALGFAILVSYQKYMSLKKSNKNERNS